MIDRSAAVSLPPELQSLGYRTPCLPSAEPPEPGRHRIALHAATACFFTAARPQPTGPRTAADGEGGAGEARQAACGFSLAWHRPVSCGCGGGQDGASTAAAWLRENATLSEATIGTTGLRQGAPAAPRAAGAEGPPSLVPTATQSSVCRRQILRAFGSVLTHESHAALAAAAASPPDAAGAIVEGGLDYGRLKGQAGGYQRAASVFRSAEPFREWVVGLGDGQPGT